MVRRSWTQSSTACLALVAISAALLANSSAASSPSKQGYTQGADAGVLGWDGDGDAAVAHMDGSFDVRDGMDLTVRFGIASGRNVQWYNDKGYLPALVTRFQREHATVTITNFGDKVTLGGRPYVLVYSRVSIANHDHRRHSLDPAPSGGVTRLNAAPNAVAAGGRVDHDYVIAIDRFGGSYGWPTSSALRRAGGWTAHYGHMQAFWDARLSGIVRITRLPDPRLINAYKAGYVYTMIVKDGNDLIVGENGYGRLFDHDLIGILVGLFVVGDYRNAHAYLDTLFWNQVGEVPANADAKYKYSWPWAVYLLKTGDTAFVRAHLDKIRESAHSIESDRKGPNEIIKASNSIDANGYWTVDDESALLGLLSYRYIAQRLGDSAEAEWADRQYTSLLDSVNHQLTRLMSTYGISYLPCSLSVPNDQDRCTAPQDANWASMFLFGRWSWDGYLFDGSQQGPLLDLIDPTYDYGFGRLRTILPAHTYGGYPNSFTDTPISTGYNAGYGAAGLRGEKYRSEGILDYQFMINETQGGPYSWWENSISVGTSHWTPGRHTLLGAGSCPHMWGQANATKVLIDSLIAEKVDGTLLIGRGIPDAWTDKNDAVSLTNAPLAANKRFGYTLRSTGTTLDLSFSGAQPSNSILVELPILRNNISATTTGSIDDKDGIVALPASTKRVTITLAKGRL